MENASKALIMAGGVLIGVLIMTIFVYIFTSIGSSSKEIQSRIDERVIADFNNNFFKYQGSKDCTIHDIVSIANFANKNNVDFARTDNNYVKVYLGSNELTASSSPNTYYIQLLEEDRKNTLETGKVQYYTCTGIQYTNYGDYRKVNRIDFRKN